MGYTITSLTCWTDGRSVELETRYFVFNKQTNSPDVAAPVIVKVIDKIQTSVARKERAGKVGRRRGKSVRDVKNTATRNLQKGHQVTLKFTPRDRNASSGMFRYLKNFHYQEKERK